MSSLSAPLAIEELYATMRSVVDEATFGEHREAFGDLRSRLVTAPAFSAIEPQRRDVTEQWLEAALATNNQRWRAMSIAARTALPHLRWQISYQNLPPSAGLASFQNDYSWAPLTMPSDEAPVRLDGTLAGFTLQAPHITYPGHHHKPVEIYGIVSGPIEWKLGDGPWQLKQPGDVIVHRSHELHAMRTLDEPCLTWVAWDQFNADSVYMPSLDPPGQTMTPLSYS